MRFTALAVLVLSATAAFASEPGQPLDCSDWVFLEPGYACERVDNGNDQSRRVEIGSWSQFDNAGRLFRVSPPRSIVVGTCGNEPLYRTRLEWLNAGTWQPLGYVDDRCLTAPGADRAYGGTQETSQGPPALTFDASGGRMFVNLTSSCDGGGIDNCSAYPPGSGSYWIAAIRGFATTFDILQTFTPTASAVGFRVPYMPEGLAAADHFDTYYGPLTHPINFASAQPLACDYPAAAPSIGDYLEVPAAVPDPPAGQGYWCLTSVTYQGETRYGRKASGGRLSGRDPGVFPACVAR
jgi:hypothetical protein